MAIDEELDLPRPFGPYTLVRRLAVGGMAEVYVAKTKGLGGFEKHVAIKVIHPRYSEDEHFVQMLVEEAKISVLLTHVNIAQTFDLGCIDDTYYIVMELIEGADAYRIMRKTSEMKRAMPIDLCAHIAAEMCNGLDYAHRKRDAEGNSLGIVHRDISPQNVLISYAGEVKIVDFGIAKAALRSGQTEAGVIKGKYYYMSPEQAWGDPMDHRSDIFSVGVVLYELLTGRMLYQEDNVPLLLDKVRKVDVQRPESRRPSIPRALSDIVMKALSKEPIDRYQSAQEMAQALTQFLHQSSPTFTAARLAELMGTLFPNEVQRHSAIMKLPSVEEPLERGTRESIAPAAQANSVLFDLGDDDDEDDATRNDILPFRKGQRAAKARAPEPDPPPAPEPSARPTHRPPRGRTTEATNDRVTAPVVGPSGAWVSPIAESATTSPLRAPEEPTDDTQAAPEWDDPTRLKEEDWEEDATLVDASGLAAALRVAAPPLVGAQAKSERGKVNVQWAGKAPPSPAARPAAPGPAPAARAAPAPTSPRPPAPAAKAAIPQVAAAPAAIAAPAAVAPAAPPPSAVPAPPAVPSPAGPPPTMQPATPPPALHGSSVAPSPPVAAPRPPWEAPAAAAPAPWTASAPPAFTMPQPGADPFAPPPPQPAAPADSLERPSGSGRRLALLGLGAVVVLALAALSAILLIGSGPAPAIEVISSPTGASVAIDGRPLPGVTPLLVQEGIESGRTYRVDVTMAGYQPWSAQLSPTEGPLRQFVVLAPLPATLRVETEPAGATVMVNGVERGQSPVELPGLQVGQEVEVRVLVPGRAPVIRRVRLGEGTTSERILVAGP